MRHTDKHIDGPQNNFIDGFIANCGTDPQCKCNHNPDHRADDPYEQGKSQSPDGSYQHIPSHAVGPE